MKNTFGLSSIGKWLATLKMTDYEQLLISSGFDDLKFMVRKSGLVSNANLQYGNIWMRV